MEVANPPPYPAGATRTLPTPTSVESCHLHRFLAFNEISYGYFSCAASLLPISLYFDVSQPERTHHTTTRKAFYMNRYK
jgi:hypothetical protein